MARKLLNDKIMMVRLPKWLLDMVLSVLGENEHRADFIRDALHEKAKRRLRNK